jgi:hypothetical protein
MPESLNKGGKMDENRTSRNFILDLFESKDEKQVLNYILDGLDEKDIIEKIVDSCKKENKND